MPDKGSKVHFHSPKYTGGVPDAAGDRYWSQDLLRDFLHHTDENGKALMATVYPWHDGDTETNGFLKRAVIKSDGISDGGGNTINIGNVLGVVSVEVTIPDSFASSPPSTDTLKIAVPLRWEYEAAIAPASPTLDGSTPNYVILKVALTEVSGKSRQRAKAAGTYTYEYRWETSYRTSTSSVTADNEINIGYFTGTGGGTFTVVNEIESGVYSNPSIEKVPKKPATTVAKKAVGVGWEGKIELTGTEYLLQDEGNANRLCIETAPMVLDGAEEYYVQVCVDDITILSNVFARVIHMDWGTPAAAIVEDSTWADLSFNGYVPNKTLSIVVIPISDTKFATVTVPSLSQPYVVRVHTVNTSTFAITTGGSLSIGTAGLFPNFNASTQMATNTAGDQMIVAYAYSDSVSDLHVGSFLINISTGALTSRVDIDTNLDTFGTGIAVDYLGLVRPDGSNYQRFGVVWGKGTSGAVGVITYDREIDGTGHSVHSDDFTASNQSIYMVGSSVVEGSFTARYLMHDSSGASSAQESKAIMFEVSYPTGQQGYGFLTQIKQYRDSLIETYGPYGMGGGIVGELVYISEVSDLGTFMINVLYWPYGGVPRRIADFVNAGWFDTGAARNQAPFDGGLRISPTTSSKEAVVFYSYVDVSGTRTGRFTALRVTIPIGVAKSSVSSSATEIDLEDVISGGFVPLEYDAIPGEPILVDMRMGGGRDGTLYPASAVPFALVDMMVVGKAVGTRSAKLNIG
jgi:hypothetical protein